MNCPPDEVLQRLHEATATDGAGVAAHVRGCERCRARVEALAAVAATLDSSKTVAREGPPSDAVGVGVAIGPYVVSRRLGAGAMGAVYAAWDARLEREVALKVLHEALGDLIGEARLLARLSHPNVVTVHEVMPWNGRTVLVMELARGLTLRQWLAAAPRPVPSVLEVFRQCAAGLAAAHAAGIVHRDFKPDNALVDESGRARLLDFGLAMTVVGAGAAGLAGSPAYLGLQQLEGAPADARSDQYAWWVSLYEALAGRRPHDANTLAALVEARRTQPVDLAPLPAWLRPHAARGLSNDPAARFPSMEAAARALVPPRRWGLLALGVSAVAAALVAGTVTLARPSPCAAVSVSPAELEARAKDPALRDAVRDFAAGLEACRALATESQPDRAACLEQTGRELDLALAAVEGSTDVPEALRARVLRRVRPASRCAKAPAPQVTLPTDAERAALVASLGAQLRFDALREAGDADALLRFAREHRAEAEASRVPVALAWAHLNEATALSVKGQSNQAVLLLRGLEAVPGLGLREQAWGALGAWLLECYVSPEAQCLAQQQRALRLANELDEPWANAWRDEVSLRYLEAAPPVDEVIKAWSALPGAGFEARRALANELAGLVDTDDRLRLLRARALADVVQPLSGRLQLLVWQVDLALALHEGDLARARGLVQRLEQAEPSVHQARAVFEGRLTYLGATQRYREALALIAKASAPEGDVRFRYRMLLGRVSLLHRLGDPTVAEAEQQLELVRPMLGAEEEGYLNVMRASLALARGDAAALAQLPVSSGDEVLRAWHLAVLRGDGAEEARLLALAAAAGPEDFVGRRLQVSALLQAARWTEAAEAAARLRQEVPSFGLEHQVRLLEAWARWQLGEKDAACRLMTTTLVSVSLVPRERAWAQTLTRECPRVGLSAADD